MENDPLTQVSVTELEETGLETWIPDLSNVGLEELRKIDPRQLPLGRLVTESVSTIAGSSGS